MIIEALDDSYVKRNKLIVINNINEGFNKYINEVLDYSRYTVEEAFNKYYNILEKSFESFDNSFIFDFYKANITDNSLIIIKNNVEEEDYKIIENIYNSAKDNTHFYKSNDINALRALLNLSIKELYFITFYFIDVTIWSNYNQKFITLKKKIED